jgi:methionyl-tRNA formyltransferase
MRLILLTHGGADLVIRELCRRPELELAGVFIEDRITPQRPLSEKIRRSLRYDGALATIGKFSSRLFGGNGSGDTSPDLTEETARSLGVDVFHVDNYHDPESLDLIREANADLGVVFGTNIVKESVFSIPRLGSINLHQGLAPLYRGGPPVFWELFNDEKEIGLTVHFVAPKVDTGDIVLQKKVPLKYDTSIGTEFETFLINYRESLRHDCAKMVATAASMIANGEFSRTKQDTSLGKRYRLPIKREKDELRRRLARRIANG